MPAWTHAESAADYQAWEALAAEMGNVVKDLKGGGGSKEDVDAAVAELLHRKTKFKESLEAAIAAAPDEATKTALSAKLPAAPSKSKQDKKKEKKETGPDPDKEAKIKAQKEAELAARAKRKAEAEAKKAATGTPPDTATKAPPAEKATKAPPGEKAATPASMPSKPPAAGEAGKKVVVSKTTELWFTKEAPPLLALLAARLAKREVALKKVDAKQLPGGQVNARRRPAHRLHTRPLAPDSPPARGTIPRLASPCVRLHR